MSQVQDSKLELPGDVQRRFAAVTFLLLDVDGVLTDGQIHFDADGRETKSFHVHDGSGLVYWKRSGFASGFLSGRDSVTVRARAEELMIDEVHLGCGRKMEVLQEILQRRGLSPAEVLYIGDDLLDIPVLEEVGVPVCVPQARPEVKERCCYVTRAPAGGGAVREVVEFLLRAKGLFQRILDAGGLPFEDGDPS